MPQASIMDPRRGRSRIHRTAQHSLHLPRVPQVPQVPQAANNLCNTTTTTVFIHTPDILARLPRSVPIPTYMYVSVSLETRQASPQHDLRVCFDNGPLCTIQYPYATPLTSKRAPRPFSNRTASNNHPGTLPRDKDSNT